MSTTRGDYYVIIYMLNMWTCVLSSVYVVDVLSP